MLYIVGDTHDYYEASFESHFFLACVACHERGHPKVCISLLRGVE